MKKYELNFRQIVIVVSTSILLSSVLLFFLPDRFKSGGTAEADRFGLMKQQVEMLDYEIRDMKREVNLLTTKDIEIMLVDIDMRINNLSTQLDSLQQIISPQGATEILTVARMKDEILKREEFEKRSEEKLKNSQEQVNRFQAQINRVDDKLDGLRNWVIGVLVTLISGLILIVWYLIKRLGQMAILLQDTLSTGSTPTISSGTESSSS